MVFRCENEESGRLFWESYNRSQRKLSAMVDGKDLSEPIGVTGNVHGVDFNVSEEDWENKC